MRNYIIYFTVSEDMRASLEANSPEEAREKFLGRFTKGGEFDPAPKLRELSVGAVTEAGPSVDLGYVVQEGETA